MTTTILTFNFYVDGVLTDATAVPFGKSPQTYDNVRGLLGYTPASINNSVSALTASFTQTPQALLIDTGIDAHTDKLRDVLAHWSVAA